MRKFWILFDRSFAKSYLKQILWLLGIMVLSFVVLLLLGLIPAFYQAGNDADSRGLFFDVLFLLFDPGSMTGNMSSPYVTLVALVGIIVFCGFFISVVTNMLERRVEMYESGQLRYSLRNHVIIIGYNKLTIPLIKHLCNEDDKVTILLQTATDIAQVRTRLDADLSEDEEKHLIVYSGEQTLADDCKSLQADRCKFIYLLGDEAADSHDSLNLDTLNLLAGILHDKHVEQKIRCYVQFYNSDIFSSFQYADIKETVKKQIYFLPFNFEDIWSQKILVYNQAGQPIDGAGISSDSKKHVHVIINAVTPMGIAMALQAARIGHFPNVKATDLSTLTHITFIDPDAKNQMERFCNHYAELFRLSYCSYWEADNADRAGWSNPIENDEEYSYLAPNFIDVKWEFVQGNIYDSQVRTYLTECAKDQSAYTSLFLCKQDADDNMTDSIQLPDIVYKSGNILQVFVHQGVSTAFVDMVTKANQSKFSKIIPIGQYADFFSTDLVPEEFGKMVNARYCGITDMSLTDQIDALWENLSTANKWSSMYSANMRFVRLRSLGINANEQFDTLQQTIDANVASMMMVEKNRWNMEKLLGGFRPLTEAESIRARSDSSEKKRLRAAPYYAHLDICSLDMLRQIDAGAIRYDEDVIRALPDMLAQL